MPHRILVTYDVKSINSYDAFYDLVERFQAIKLTESTYLFDVDCSLTFFIQELSSVFNKSDNVWIAYREFDGDLTTKKIC